MNKKGKLLTLAIVGILLAGGGVINAGLNNVNASEPAEGVLSLFSDYYNQGSYTRNTSINFNKTNGAYDVETYFHAKADDLERTTYFNGNELWMTNSNGVNSGYGTDGNNMTHFRKDLKTGENISVYTAVKNTTMEDYYQTLYDFANATYENEWVLNGNIYSSTSKELINQFGLFTAPCFLGFEGDRENLLTFSHVEVEEVNETLEMRLYVKEDSKGWLQNQEGLLFSKAVITKGGEIEKVKPELNYHFIHNQEIGIETIRDNFNSLFSVTPSSVEYTYKFIDGETFGECLLENLLVGRSYYLEIFAEETIKQEAGEYSGNKLLNGRLFTVTEGKPTITYSDFQGTYEEGGVQFTPDKLLDGSLETCAWFTSAPTKDSYILVDLLKPQLIESITVYNGNRTSGDAGDLTLYGSKDNTSYKVLGYVRIGEDGTDCTVNLLEPGSYRYIKVADIDSGGNWFALRELNINTTDKVATYNDFDGIHQGDLKNIIDGDESSYVWLSGSPKVSSCVMVELNEVIELKDLTILQGTEGNTDSLIGKVEVSEDGTNWNYVGEITVENQLEAVFDIHKNSLNVKYIKLTHNGSRSNWVIIREILVNTMIHRDFTYENIDGLFSEGVLENAYDGNYDTYAWFDYNNKANASFTLDLGEVKEINNIDVVMGQYDEHTDYFHHYELLVSDDGTTWDKLGEYKDTRVLKLDLEESITIRYVKVHALALDLDNNIVIREIAAYYFEVIEKVDPAITFSFENGQIFEYDGTNETPNISVTVTEGVEYTWEIQKDEAIYGDGHTIPTEPGTYALVVQTVEDDTHKPYKTWCVFSIKALPSAEIKVIEPVFDNEGTYNVNGSAKAPLFVGFVDGEGNEVEVDAADYEVTYGNDTVGYTTTAPTEPGNYVIVVTLKNTTDYAYATGRVWANSAYKLVDITKVDPEVTFSFEPSQSFVYDGTGETPDISVSVPEGVEYTWKIVKDEVVYGDGHTIPTEPGYYALDITTVENDTYNSVHKWRVFVITAPASQEVTKVTAVFENNTPYTEGHPTLTGFVDEEGNPVDVPTSAYTVNFESDGGYNSPEAPTEAGWYAMVVKLTDDAYAFANGKSYNHAVFKIVEA